jgi:hypothetical protein
VTGAYQDWVTWLDAFAAGKDTPTPRLIAVDALGPIAGERIRIRIADAFIARVSEWDAALARCFGSELVTDPMALADVLTDARRGLAPIQRFANDARYPEDIRAAMKDALRQKTVVVQQQLEKAAGTTTWLRDLVRDNRIDAPVPVPLPPVPVTPVRPTGRRVIVDRTRR